MDIVGGPAGPRAALGFGVLLLGIGAILLRPVDARRREDPTPEIEPMAVAPEAVPS
jgi:hypothetical protein